MIYFTERERWSQEKPKKEMLEVYKQNRHEEQTLNPHQFTYRNAKNPGIYGCVNCTIRYDSYTT